MEEIRLEATIAAAPAKVWAVFTDHVGYTKWAGVKEVVLRQEGEPPPNGLGAIRVIRAGGIAIEEEIVTFEPPKRFGYRLTSGVPIRDHQAEVVFEPAGAGTRLTWNIRFQPKLPGTGWLLRKGMQRTLSEMLERLARVDFTSIQA